MVCNDRQLSQAQREAGYQQQRTGVPLALRPFSGSATIENLIDYLNRELVPGVRATRSAVNDIFLQVADQAPSANPLSYYFATDTANSDPTAGRIKLDASPQNAAATIRISQSNARLQDVTPWLDVMSGGPTVPLGTVTLIDAINPGRFIRADLNSMADQGSYWDLDITVIESSHDDPFVEDEAVTLAFIAGVSGAGSTVPVGSISPIARDTFLGNISTVTQAPAAVPLADVDSTSIVYDATSHTFQRAALTGFATASQNSNATSSAEPIVTYSASANMSAERVLTSSTSNTISTAVANQIAVESTAITGAVAIAANGTASTFAGIRDNGAAENDRTNLNFVSNNDITLTVTDDSGNDELEITATLAAGSTQNEGTGGAVTLNAGTKVLAITTNISISGFARSGGNVDGDRFWVRCNDGIECTLQHATGTVANQMSLPYAEDMIVPGRGMIEFRYEGSWRGISTGNKGRLLRVTTYTSGSGTHTYLNDARAARVRMKGGGGGGGGAGAPDGNVAGGGGEGAYEELWIDDLPSSSAYEVGAAGTAGSSSSGTGGTGGDTDFNDGSVTRTAGGGSGGIAGGAIGEGGAGGSPDSIGGTVVYACRGAPGQYGFLSSIPEGFGGNGGGSGAGKGGTNGSSSEAGSAAASNSGAGGGGGSRPNSPNVAGAAGGSGYIIVEEYT